MPIVFSYSWKRNPQKLMESAGISRIASGAAETEFIKRISRFPPQKLGCLCLVMGGFMDGLLGRAYSIIDDLALMWRRGVDVFYREHDEDAAAEALIAAYGRLGRPIVCIGHSWGASTLARDVLPGRNCRALRVEALVTLDPVGVRGPVPLPNVRKWLNVYIPYEKAEWSRENNVARVGNPWQRVPFAWRNEIPSVLRHPDARGMFREYGAAMLDEVLRPYIGW